MQALDFFQDMYIGRPKWDTCNFIVFYYYYFTVTRTEGLDTTCVAGKAGL